MSDADEAAYELMIERIADFISEYLRRAEVVLREHVDLACAHHLLAEAKKESLASRLALARALVPGWAVVPVEPSRQMMECAVVRHYNKGSLAEVWTAMLTAAEEPPHGP